MTKMNALKEAINAVTLDDFAAAVFKLWFVVTVLIVLLAPFVAHAIGPQEIPTDRRGLPIPVLKFGPAGSGTMYITYDSSSREDQRD